NRLSGILGEYPIRFLNWSLIRNAVPSPVPVGVIFTAVDGSEARRRRRACASCSQQSGQSGQVIGGHRLNKAGSHPFDTGIDGLRHTADGFGPAECLFDLLSGHLVGLD
ncbi:hypothetical protein, partial [Paracoccus seriniphilus]|uniref:hypothetical protein n=1 Tax=Paracoccus seriniphilus TaxID=184748 RepID=UPI004034F79F